MAFLACSGMKQQMKPLTSQQDVLLCSDDNQNDKANLIEEKSNVQLPNCDAEISNSATLEDSISESSLSVKQTELNQVNSSSNEDLPGDSDFKYSSSESLLPNSSVVTETDLKDLTELDDIATTNISELSSYSPDVADLDYGNQVDGSAPSELESSKVSNEASSQLSSETLDIDTSIDLKSNATLDPQPSNDLSQVDTDFEVTHELENDKIDKSPTGTILTTDEKDVFLVKETITTLDQSSLTGIGLSEANKESESAKLVETISNLSPSDPILQIDSFSHAGIPAPSLVSPSLQVPLGKVLVPAVIDQIQGHAFSAMQILKVLRNASLVVVMYN